MECYLPHELVLIGCGKRIDSVQPEKNSISRKEEVLQSVLGAPKLILGSAGYWITDRRMSSVIGYLTQITETETENFPVGYSVGYST